MKFLWLFLMAVSLYGSDFVLMKDYFDKGDIKRAIYYARTNALNGDANAMYDLGLLYYAQGDAKNARIWLERSVKNDGKGGLGLALLLFTQSRNRDGYTKVSEILIDVPKGKLRDALMAVSLDLADNRRDATAEEYIVLGELFANDRLVHTDMGVALFLINQAAKKGDAKALEMMGDAYWRSAYTKGALVVAPESGRSMEIAYEYYEKASALNNFDALAKMGRLYIEAPWIYTKTQYGVQLILRSANEGSAVGAQMAAELYLNGIGVRADRSKALEWYKKATDICEVNKILSDFYGQSSEAKAYAMAYEKCKKASVKQRYHILFEPF